MSGQTSRFNLSSEKFLPTAEALAASVRGAQIGEIGTINEYHELIERLRATEYPQRDEDIAAIEELIKDEQNHRGVLQRIEQRLSNLGLQNYNNGLNGVE